MSKQDRNDAMWLAENWDKIQAFKAENDIASNRCRHIAQGKSESG